MKITLPPPLLKGGVSVEEAIYHRRSVRKYKKQDLKLTEISQLLWAAQGIIGKEKFRTAPSAGALYPMEIYLVSAEGVFRYKPDEHALLKIKEIDIRRQLADAAWGQEFISDAAITIIISAIYRRVTSRYGTRGVMYTDMEAGHIAQNIHLQAVAIGLGSVPVGAFDEEKVRQLIGVSTSERPIYLIPVGYSR